ncbi:methyltransferase domain-containing protein, partial [Candidatus Marithioploca araucensis]|nr:methyltransferase domain-containing protein [Candidatus Marithioploca araucensis]
MHKMWSVPYFRNNFCPVSKSDQLLLKNLGNWSFTKVDASGILPFEDNYFNFVFHQDVVEHTDKPYTFLKEQYTVFRGGGTLLCGPPNLFRPANIVTLMTGPL